MSSPPTTAGYAFTVNGHDVEFACPPADAPAPGAYVGLHADGGRAYLAQVIEIAPLESVPPVRTIVGRGVLRARVEGARSAPVGPQDVFGSAEMVPADPAVVQAHLSDTLGDGAVLEIGTLRGVPCDPPARLRASGFARHTLVCGQSGSGKTYALAVLLERLLLATGIRVVVLDPNSDYVRLRELRPVADAEAADDESNALAERYRAATRDVHVFGSRDGSTPLRVRFGRLTLAQQASILDIHPIRDAEEYHAFTKVVRGLGTSAYRIEDLSAAVMRSFEEGARRLALRIDNLGVAEQSIWVGPGERAVLESLSEHWRGVVLDLGSLPTAEERSIVAASAMTYLWEQRHARTPTLVVIDEAHNACPRVPVDRHQALAIRQLTAIAGEGRKYGLYLLLVTQRPDKIDDNVLSQCENLVLMRMNSAADVEHLATVFSHVPAPLLRLASGFRLGEGLAAGRIAPDVTLFRSGRRYSVEGGADVAATWARPR